MDDQQGSAVMDGPWADYAPAPKQADGPWADYAAPPKAPTPAAPPPQPVGYPTMEETEAGITPKVYSTGTSGPPVGMRSSSDPLTPTPPPAHPAVTMTPAPVPPDELRPTLPNLARAAAGPAGQAAEILYGAGKNIVSGSQDVFGQIGEPLDKPKMLTGATKILSGAGTAALAVGAPELAELGTAAAAGDTTAIAALQKVALSMGVGAAVGEGAGKTAEAVHLSPEAQQLAKTAGFWAGAGLTGIAAKIEPTTGEFGERGYKASIPGASVEGSVRPAYRQPSPEGSYGEGSTVVPRDVNARVTVGGKSAGTTPKGGPWEDYAPAAPAPTSTPKALPAPDRPVVQASTDPAAIRESAAAQEKPTVAAVEKAVEDVDGATVDGSRVKDEDSQANKAGRDKPVETQKDHLGVRVAADTPEAQTAAIGKIAETMPVVGTEPLENNGLKGTQVFVQTGKPGEANQTSEIQVLPTSQVAALKETDELYDQQKKALAAGDTEKAEELGKKIHAIHDAALNETNPAKDETKGVEDSLDALEKAEGRPGDKTMDYAIEQVAVALTKAKQTVDDIPGDKDLPDGVLLHVQQVMEHPETTARPGGPWNTAFGRKSAEPVKSDDVGTKYEFGSTQANLPEDSPAAKAIVAMQNAIPDADLAGDGKDIDRPHVTVRYGLKGEITPELRAFIESQAPFEAKLGATQSFPPKDGATLSGNTEPAAVIMAPVESPELHALNAAIEKAADFKESDFPEYKPHVTVAYVKPELAAKYTGMKDAEGKAFPIDSIAISDKNGEHTEIPLKGGALPSSEREGGRGESPEPTGGGADNALPPAENRTASPVPEAVAESTAVPKSEASRPAEVAPIKTGSTVKLPDGRTGVVKGISPKGDVEVKLDGGGRARSVRSAVQVVEPETVTLYRGEVKPGSRKPPADWIQSSDKWKAAQEAAGRWFTPNIEDAKFYQNDAAAGTGQVVSVQIPKTELDKYSARNNPEAAKFMHATKRGGADQRDEYFLPRELASQAKPVADVPVEGVTAGTPGHEKPKHGAIAVDFDLTLSTYDGYKGPTVLGKPIVPMVDAVKKMLADGEDVWIYTARAKDAEAIPAIQAWTKEHIGKELPVTNVKYSEFKTFIDDRAELPVQMQKEESDAVQKRGAEEVHEREQGPAGEKGSGRERVEPVKQGDEVASARPKAEPVRSEGEVQSNGGQAKESSPVEKFKSAAKSRKPKAAQVDTARAAQLANHFTPGNVIRSDYWRDYDKVLAFNPDTGKGWSVRVIKSDAEGNPIKGEAPRQHSTYPSPKDVVVKRGAEGPLDLAKTGQPFEAKLYSGSGRTEKIAAYGEGAVSKMAILGDGKYYSPDKEYASHFGPSIEETNVSLDNPLVIDNDADWRALTKEAGWAFPNPVRFDPKESDIQRAEIERMNDLIRSKGYDGVIIRVPESEADGKTLQNVFDESQVIAFPKEPSAPAQTQEEPAESAEPLIEPDPKATKKAAELGSAFYSGLDPALFERLFPDATARIKDWLAETQTDADHQKAMMRQTRGEMDRRVAVVMQKLATVQREWRTRPREDSIAFWNAVESGDVKSLPEKDQALAKLFKGAFDKMRGELQELKPEALRNYIENYFPHLWDRPSQVSAHIKGLLTGKRPFAGKGSFLKKRSIPTMQDGLDLGFKPKTWNPVDSFLLKYAEMAQFLMGHQTLAMMKPGGTAKYIPIGSKAPEGWTQLDDRLGTVYGDPNIPITEYFDKAVWNALQETAQNLLTATTRKVKIGGTRLGYYSTLDGIVTKTGTPLDVMAHELGHAIDQIYGLKDQLVKDKRFKQELRDLADLRFEGSEPSPYYKSYVRKGEEKMAAIFQAYVHTPERFQETAPNTYAHIKEFLASHEELKPLADLKKSMTHQARQDTVNAGGMVIRGYYYSPAEAARVFNNFVSKGLAGRSGVYDVLNAANQNLNALQLGISAFHAATTTINGATSDVALGLQQLAEGKPLKAGVSLAQGLTIAPSMVRTMVNGSRLMREYLTPGSYQKFGDEARALATAGGRIKQNTIDLKPMGQVANAWRNGAITEGLTKLPGAITEWLARPIMEHYVPRMKVGAFYSLAHDVLDQAQRHGWDAEKTRTKMQQAWDSIDNRFGQVVYDNLFWNKALQDSLRLSQRSVGWNFGDLRELGGGVVDTARQAGRAAQGEIPEMSPRMAFALALPLVSALIGGVLHYLWNGHRPDTWKGYFYPKTSDGTAHSIPGYMKDVFSVAHDPVQATLNKLAPIWSLTAEAINNRDFYGTEIRHKDDSPLRQLGEFSSWAAQQAIPFSISGATKLLENRGADDTFTAMLKAGAKHPGDVILGQLGFQPAPAFVQNSDALNAARDYNRENRPPGTKTQDQAEHLKAFDAVVQMYRTGKVDRDQIERYKQEGKIDQASVAKAAMESRKPPIVLASTGLSIEQILNVYDKATPQEQDQLRPLVARKFPQIREIEDPDRKQDVEESYRRAMSDRQQTATR